MRTTDLSPPPRAIILNCFGRGGSSIVWNMIGASPDVLMPAAEWHQGAFRSNALRKAARVVGRRFDWANVPMVWRIWRDRTAATIPPAERAEKPEAEAVTLKVMGYHTVFNAAIERGFLRSDRVVLTRHPLPMVEGLVRGGSGEADAIQLFNEVTDSLADEAARPGTTHVRFEALLADPIGFRDALCTRLSIRVPEGGRTRLKMKPFGAARTQGVSVNEAEVRWVTPEEARAAIDSEVNRKAVARLSEARKAAIWAATSRSAGRVGYGEADF